MGHPEFEIVHPAIKVQVDPRGHRFGKIDVESIFVLLLITPEYGDDHRLQVIEEIDQAIETDFRAGLAKLDRCISGKIAL
jgi:hypothetical protein